MSDAVGAALNKQSLSNRMWKTKGSRFNAHRRLSKTARCQAIALQAISANLLFYSALSYADKLPTSASGIAGAVSLLMAIFVLMLSISNAHAAVGVRAIKLYNSAKFITSLKDSLDACAPEQEGDIRRIAQEYNSHLNETDANHDEIDYQRFVLEHRAWFQSQPNDGTALPGGVLWVLQYLRYYLFWPLIATVCVAVPGITLLILVAAKRDPTG